MPASNLWFNQKPRLHIQKPFSWLSRERSVSLTQKSIICPVACRLALSRVNPPMQRPRPEGLAKLRSMAHFLQETNDRLDP